MKHAVLIAGGLATALLLFPCAVDPGPFFKPGELPENETQFENGKPGLITPKLDKTHELLAFRILSGLPSVAGRKAAVPSQLAHADPVNAWLNSRNQALPGTPPDSRLTGFYLGGYKSSGNVYYQNCLDDAFLTATLTLADRHRIYRNDVEFRGWVEAQDQVFANCSGKTPTYPAAPAPGLSALARADRRYQIAAAHFYAEDFDTAEKLFQAIAADPASPWQKTGGYMAGRTLLRKASLGNDSSAANAAREQFRKIADDPSAAPFRDSARGLLEHLDAIDHAPDLLESLAKKLMAPQPDATFEDALASARYVMLADSFRFALAAPRLPEPFDWVRTLEADDDKAETHAVEQWRTTGSLPWLTVALIHGHGRQPEAAELIEKANAVPADSPAFATVSYNAIRLRIERGEKIEARAQLDKLLAATAGQPPSLVNAWRAERMRVATNFDDFLHWAPRTPISVPEYSSDPRTDSPVLAEDSIHVLNYEAPLARLVAAAHDTRLPVWTSADVALVAWTRAFILQNTAVMREMAPIVARAHPAWAPQLDPPPEPGEEWRFHAAVLIARNPEFQPTLTTDYRKHITTGDWWCPIISPGDPDHAPSTVSWNLPVQMKAEDAGISSDEGAAAAKEVRQLADEGAAQSVVGPIILAWAKSHPADPLAPEALYRIVRVVRYGCHGIPDNGKLSKAAFDMLHKQYPQSSWTAKTPYWFN